MAFHQASLRINLCGYMFIHCSMQGQTKKVPNFRLRFLSRCKPNIDTEMTRFDAPVFKWLCWRKIDVEHYNHPPPPPPDEK